MYIHGCSAGPSPEEQENIAELKSELELLQDEVSTAEAKSSQYEGGLIQALVEARIEVLKTTEALIEQRIHALESGARIDVELVKTEPDTELVGQLSQDIDSTKEKLERAREEAKGSGGLLGAMKQTSVATQEQTLAMLQQQYLRAKYGLPQINVDKSKTLQPAGNDRGYSARLAGTKGIESEIVEIKLLQKRFAELDYEEYIWFNIQFKAVGLDKPARAIKGILNLQDLFGETKVRLNWTIDEPINPGDTYVENGSGFEYNQFIDTHQWVRTTDLQNMTASFIVTSIIYQDGSRKDF